MKTSKSRTNRRGFVFAAVVLPDFMRKHWCEAGAHRSAAAAAKHRVLEPHVVRVRVKP